MLGEVICRIHFQNLEMMLDSLASQQHCGGEYKMRLFNIKLQTDLYKTFKSLRLDFFWVVDHYVKPIPIPFSKYISYGAYRLIEMPNPGNISKIVEWFSYKIRKYDSYYVVIHNKYNGKRHSCQIGRAHITLKRCF